MNKFPADNFKCNEKLCNNEFSLMQRKDWKNPQCYNCRRVIHSNQQPFMFGCQDHKKSNNRFACLKCFMSYKTQSPSQGEEIANEKFFKKNIPPFFECDKCWEFTKPNTVGLNDCTQYRCKACNKYFTIKKMTLYTCNVKGHQTQITCEPCFQQYMKAYNDAMGSIQQYGVFGQQQQGFNQPQQGFNQQQQQFNQPQQGFNQPQQGFNQGFNQPQQGFNQGFNQPQQGFNQGFNQPQQGFNQGFNQPQQGFNQPQQGFNQGFNQPQQGFNQPQQGFNQPQQGFNQPQQGFNQPKQQKGNFSQEDQEDQFNQEKFQKLTPQQQQMVLKQQQQMAKDMMNMQGQMMNQMMGGFNMGNMGMGGDF